MVMIPIELAKFVAEVGEAYDKICESRPDSFFRMFEGLTIEVRDNEGVIARFYEEGIEFYPEEGK